MPPAPKASRPSIARTIHQRAGSQTPTTPIKSSPLASSSTPPKTTATPRPPSRAATPGARNPIIISDSPGKALLLSDTASDLNDYLDKRFAQMDTTFERGADQLLQRMEQMTSRVDALEEMAQDLMKDDFDEPHQEQEQDSDANSDSDATTPVAASGPSLMDEKSPFL